MLHKRLLAAATATFLALGMAVGGASPAMAAAQKTIPAPISTVGNVSVYEEQGLTCNDFPDVTGGNYEADTGTITGPSNVTGGSWGTLSWNDDGISWDIEDNWTVDLCVKGGNFVVWIDNASGTGSYGIKAELGRGNSHVNFANPTYTAPSLAGSTDSTPENCLDGNGSITFIGDEGVTFTVEGIVGTFEPGDVLDGLEAGDYEITAIAPSGYGIEGDDTFTETVGSTSIDCELPLVAASTESSPENCLDGNGSITFIGDEGVTFTVEGIVGTFEPGDVLDGLEAGDYEITAIAPSGYGIEGDATFTETVGSTSIDCDVEPVIVEASVETVPTNCIDGEGSIEFYGDEGVTYTVLGVPGTFVSGDVLENLDANEYTVYASADEGYELTGPSEFTVEVEFEFIDCLPTEGTASVTFDWTAPTCDLPGGVTVNQELTSNATIFDPELSTAAASTTVVYDFIADEDATFSESEPPVLNPATGANAPTIVDWVISGEGRFLTVEISVPGVLTGPLCDDLTTKPLTEGMVTWKQPDCLGNPGSYTLTNEPGIVWTVDGVVVEGNKTYTVAAGATPTIVASLSDPAEYGFKPGQQTLWNLSFVAPTNCDLTTLALTGASNALGGLGMVAVLIMMAGTGLVVARRREAARIQG